MLHNLFKDFFECQSNSERAPKISTTILPPYCPIFSSFIFFKYWATFGYSQVSWGLLVQHAGSTPDNIQVTIWITGDETQVGSMQGKCPTHCVIAPSPFLILSNFIVTLTIYVYSFTILNCFLLKYCQIHSTL